ncbi:MAG: IS1182 family transposase [Proteobacteria bacterium]|nr:IS1182 family transposase [Pseudomonadota bacterium]MBU4011938.1 IS1182 family transposase [Pseudomonadota bacterium]MBU4067741.1 IS1182 family transposase [Pseudomonadota bacterium]MBU4099809.1 IS1182 family transposase [Pseudomonadota bacterium]MBU4125965.1 IS1182 family transposase [Pseudomonadota bacterium]
MMGHQPQVQEKLFYTRVNLNQRIPKNHILRKITNMVDFDFVYKEVKDKYGYNGNISVPPPVILKLMLLLILYNVRSERELMSTLPFRLDWLWFLDYDLDDEIPNHSVLSKARTRWGVDTFQCFFERIVIQCVQAGLVDGSKLFMDSSNIQADASNNSVVNTHDIKRYLKKSYQLLEDRLEKENNQSDDDHIDPPKTGSANSKYLSTTDPDASVQRQGGSRSKLKYKVHRGVDGKHEIITATSVTTGSVNEAHLLKPLLLEHEKTTGLKAQICVADSKYGIIENYLACNDLGLKGHFASFEKAHRGSGSQKDIFPKENFVYNPDTDSFICPNGKELKRRRFSKQRRYWEYTAPLSVCRNCSSFSQCTRSKTGRSLKRHERQEDLDKMQLQAESKESVKDIRTRQSLMERSFARSTRYGFKRARWRRLWRVKIQEYLTAAIQNVMVLVQHVKKPEATQAVANRKPEKSNRTGQFIRQFLALFTNKFISKNLLHVPAG